MRLVHTMDDGVELWVDQGVHVLKRYPHGRWRYVALWNDVTDVGLRPVTALERERVRAEPGMEPPENDEHG